MFASPTRRTSLLAFNKALSELMLSWLKLRFGQLIVNFLAVFEFSTSSLFLVWPTSLAFYDNLGLETLQPLASACSTIVVHSTDCWSASGVETDKWANASGVVELPISSRGQNNGFCWKLDTSGVEKVSFFELNKGCFATTFCFGQTNDGFHGWVSNSDWMLLAARCGQPFERHRH